MKKGINGYIAISDFIDVIIKAEEILNEKIKFCKQQIEIKQSSLNNYLNQLNDVNSKERMNNYQISEESIINIQLVECEVYFPGTSYIYAIIGLDNQSFQSNYVSRSTCQWESNENYDLQNRFFTTGQETFWIMLTDLESKNVQDAGGQGSFKIKLFEDQLRHDIWIDLFDASQSTLKSKIHLLVQWIHHKVYYDDDNLKKGYYLQQLISQTEADIEDLSFDIEDYKKDLSQIQCPFQGKQELNTLTQTPTPRQNNKIKINQQVKSDVNSENLLHYALFGIFFYLLLSLLISFEKCEFLDVNIIYLLSVQFILIIYCLLFYGRNTILHGIFHIKIIIGLITFSMIYDIVWLFFFSQNWDSPDGGLKQLYLEAPVHKYEVIMSYLMVLLKIILILLYGYINMIISDEQQITDAEEQFRILFASNQKSDDLKNFEIIGKVEEKNLSKYNTPQFQTVRQAQNPQLLYSSMNSQYLSPGGAVRFY